jgi:hypothetical protein
LKWQNFHGLQKRHYKRFREELLLKWTNYVNSGDPLGECVLWKGPKDTLFTKAIRTVLVRDAPSSLSSTVVACFCMPDMMVKNDIAKLVPLWMKGKWKQWVSGGYIYESGASYMYLLQ